MFGLRVSEQVSYDLGLVILEVPAASGPWAAIEVANRIEAAGKAVFASPIARQQKTPWITDPLFIGNGTWTTPGNGAAAAGCDINVLGAWASVLGTGVNIRHR